MDDFQAYFHTHTDITDEVIDQIRSKATVKTLRRNEYLLHEGEVCRYKSFVTKGLLRTFGLKEDGSEHILQFAPENHWTMDIESYDLKQPARYNIAAVENSEVFCWTKPDFDHLLSSIPLLKTYSERLVAHNIYTSRQRLLTVLSATPEEKYQEFVQSYPDLLQRLPLHMIAAYLGISLKTLTRIRQAQLKRS